MMKSNIRKLLLVISPSGRLINLCKKAKKIIIDNILILFIKKDLGRSYTFKRTKRLSPHGKRTILIATNMILHPDSFEVTYGGGERYLFEFVKLLNALSFDVTICQPANVTKTVTKNYFGYKVLCVPNGLWSRGFLIDFNVRIRNISEEYDHIVYFLPEVSAKHLRDDSLVISHGIWFDHENYKDGFFRTRLWWKFIKIAFTQSKYLVSVDTNTINFIRCLWPTKADRVVYIPNFYDKKSFEGIVRTENDKLKILFPRRAVINRGAYLFRDIVNLIEHDVEILWLGKGDPEANDEILSVCKKDSRCSFTGTDFFSMPNYYKKADIVVIPTLACEGTSLSCIEAMGAGCAVVATNVGGMSDLVIDNYNALVSRPEAKLIAANINKLIEDAKLRKKLSERATIFAKEFELKRWQKKWVDSLLSFNWISELQAKKWDKEQSNNLVPRIKKEWLIVTRYATHGGVESLIDHEAKLLDADVVICEEVKSYKTCPFIYKQCLTPEALSLTLKNYNKVIYHWIPKWAIYEIKKSAKVSAEFIHSYQTIGNTLDLPDMILTHSEFLKKRIRNASNKPCFIIPHSIDLNLFKPNESCKKYVGALCEYSPLKGIDIFINAWSKIHKKHPNIQAAFYGSGNSEKYFKDLASSLNTPVIFNQPTTEAHLALRDYKVFVLASRAEGMPVAVLEALAMNIPVICSALPGTIEFNKLANNRGWKEPLILFKPENINELREKIESTLQAKSHVETRPYIKKYYSTNAHAIAIENAFSKITLNKSNVN